MEQKKHPTLEKTVAQEYFENQEIQRKISPKIRKIINDIPKEVFQQLLDIFHNDKLLLYSTIQQFFSNGFENINIITTVLMYHNHELNFGEQLILARLIEYDYLPEEAKKEFMLMSFSTERVNKLTTAFSELKYGRKQEKNPNEASPKYYAGDFPGDFRDL